MSMKIYNALLLFLLLLFISFSQESFKIELEFGCNLISIPLKEFKIKENTCNIRNVLKFNPKKERWEFEKLDNLEAGKGYFICVENEKCEITIEGDTISEMSLQLFKGQNYVGFPFDISLEKLREKCKSIEGAFAYEGRKVLKQTNKFEKGRGYLLFLSSDCNLQLSSQDAVTFPSQKKSKIRVQILNTEDKYFRYLGISVNKELGNDWWSTGEYTCIGLVMPAEIGKEYVCTVDEEIQSVSVSISSHNNVKWKIRVIYDGNSYECEVDRYTRCPIPGQKPSKEPNIVRVQILNTEDKYFRYLGISVNKELGNNWWSTGEYTCNYVVSRHDLGDEYVCTVDEEIQSVSVSISSHNNVKWKIRVIYDGNSYECEVDRYTRCPDQQQPPSPEDLAKAPIVLNLKRGWNLISNPTDSEISIEDLRNFGCSVRRSFIYYDPETREWKRTTKMLPDDKGYFVYLNNECTIYLSPS
ncbi:MAG: hypothetical protein QW483_02795, partial [Nanopusillaceae archaeon]